MDISARELKGHNILAVERFWDNTRWMIEFSVLRPLGRIAFREILPQGVRGKCHSVQIAFLFLTHDDTHHIEGQMPLLTVFLEPLGLRKRRGSLFAVHRNEKVSSPVKEHLLIK